MPGKQAKQHTGSSKSSMSACHGAMGYGALHSVTPPLDQGHCCAAPTTALRGMLATLGCTGHGNTGPDRHLVQGALLDASRDGTHGAVVVEDSLSLGALILTLSSICHVHVGPVACAGAASSHQVDQVWRVCPAARVRLITPASCRTHQCCHRPRVSGASFPFQI